MDEVNERNLKLERQVKDHDVFQRLVPKLNELLVQSVQDLYQIVEQRPPALTGQKDELLQMWSLLTQF